MQFLTIALVSLLAGSSTQPSATLSGSDETPPPGMVLIPGGRTKIGTDVIDIAKLFEEHTEAREKAKGFMGETPEHPITVGDFYLSNTEITNEQYLAYVKHAGARPPFQWAKDAIDAERKRFLEEQGAALKKAREEGRDAPERQKFDQSAAEDWWGANWEGKPWAMPLDIAKKPVVYVDHTDCANYAEWAGMRLPTEFEFERAVRGGGSNVFPWGNEWKSGMASTREAKDATDITEVGKYPEGANKQGVMDLVGNVWEWTSSPYIEYPGWKHQVVKVGKGKNQRDVEGMPNWSANSRVVKSGSQANSYIFSRGPIRGGFPRYMRNNALGFRCAASQQPGLDFATELLGKIPNQIRPFNAKGPITYNPNTVIAMDRWNSAEGTVKVPGYAVVTSYDYVLFTPAEGMETNGLADIRKGAEHDELFHVGFLAANQDLVEPALPKGTYLVAVRGAAKYPDREAKASEEGAAEPAAAEEQPLFSPVRVDDFLELDPKEDNYIFLNMEGIPVASIAASKLDYGNPPKDGELGITVADRPFVQETTNADGKVTKETIQRQWVDIGYFVKGKSRKGLTANLSVRFAPKAMDGEWRK